MAPDLDANLNPDRPQMPIGMPEALKRMLGQGQPDLSKYETLGPLNDEEVKAYNEMKDAWRQAISMSHKADTLKNLFWAQLEHSRKVYDRNLHVDEKTTMLMAERKGDA